MDITLHSKLFGELNLHLYHQQGGRKGDITGYVEVPETEINGIPVKGLQWFSSYEASNDGKPWQTELSLSHCSIKRQDNHGDLTDNQRGKVYADLREALAEAMAKIPDWKHEWEKSRLQQENAYFQKNIQDKKDEIARLEASIKENEEKLARMS